MLVKKAPRAPRDRRAPPISWGPRAATDVLLPPIYTYVPRKHPGAPRNTISTAVTFCIREIPSWSPCRHSVGGGSNHGGPLHQHPCPSDELWVVYHRPTCNAPDIISLFVLQLLPFPVSSYIYFLGSGLCLRVLFLLSCISYHVIMCIAFAYMFISCI